MKNYVLFALIIGILFVAGCSKSESEPTFSPPSWIKGSWVQTSNIFGEDVDGGYKFTSDGIYLILASQLIDANLGQDPTAAEETNSDSEYTFKFTINDVLTSITCVPGSASDEIECTANSTTTVYSYSLDY